jgi:hypothetical protein
MTTHPVLNARSAATIFTVTFTFRLACLLNWAFDSSSIAGPQSPFFTVQGGDDLPTDRRDAGFKRQPCDDLLE